MVMAHAFEPGHERICTPSADGQTFECRDKSAGTEAESPAKDVASVATASTAAVAPSANPTSATNSPTPAPKPAASKLPNYLRQDSPTVAPKFDGAPATTIDERPASTGQAARDDQSATAADASPAKAQAQPFEPADANQVQGVVEPAAEPVQQRIAEPAPTPTPASQTAATPASNPDVSRVMEESAPLAPSAPASRTESAGVQDAGAFRTLPAGHYTLVLASVRDPAALGPLISALDAQSSQLYLLKLGMPDGDWYSLCWSDFADIETARAARADLPANAPISSGWPRRIGLLQKELAR